MQEIWDDQPRTHEPHGWWVQGMHIGVLLARAGDWTEQTVRSWDEGESEWECMMGEDLVHLKCGKQQATWLTGGDRQL